MEKDKPFGGQLNYDQKNRQAYDGRVAIPGLRLRSAIFDK
jgi:hypothetical protein